MAKVLVVYYSSWGHVEQMALAAAEGARAAGAEVSVRRVPELVPEDVAKAAYYKLDQEAPLATVDDLVAADGIIFATPTRFGMMAAQMKNFIDQTGGLWFTGALVGKVGGVMVSTGSQHGGQESTLLSFHTVMLHQGMIIAGLPYSFAAQMGVDETKGGSPYGATTISGGDGSRQPSKVELDGARYQGGYIANIAARIAGVDLKPVA